MCSVSLSRVECLERHQIVIYLAALVAAWAWLMIPSSTSTRVSGTPHVELELPAGRG